MISAFEDGVQFTELGARVQELHYKIMDPGLAEYRVAKGPELDRVFDKYTFLALRHDLPQERIHETKNIYKEAKSKIEELIEGDREYLEPFVKRI